MFHLPEDFRLHETTRRRLGLAVFVGLCLAPTAGVLAWGVSRMLPTHARGEAARLGQQLGLRVDLEKVRHPRPGVVVYEGLQLAEPESARVILRASRVTATWSRADDPKADCGQAMALAVEGAEIDGAGLGRLAEVVLRGMRQEPPWSRLEVRLGAAEARLAAGATPWALRDVQGFLQPVQGGCHGQISFRIAGIESEKPVSIRVGRDRGKTPPSTGLELSTGGGTLPCALLATAFPDLARLGRQAGFNGCAWMNDVAGRRTYQLTGRLANVDLESAMAGRLGHALTGTAQVSVDLARLADGRLEEAAGSVTAGPGTVGRSLLDAAVERLGLARGVDPRGEAEIVPYEQLGFCLSIGPEGIRVRGTCPVPGPGSVMVDPYSRLLGEPDPRSQPIAVGALVRTLALPGGTDVPATRQAEWLMRVLPLPEQGTGADFRPASLSHADSPAPGQ